MSWEVTRTETFSQTFKKYSKNREFITALDKKILRLEENPYNVGGWLSGQLQGYRATRLMKNFRIVFKISEQEHKVYLMAIDHRKFDYERF